MQPCGEDVRREGAGDRGGRGEGQVQRSGPQLPHRQVCGGETSSAQPQSQSTSGPEKLSSPSELPALAPKLLTLPEENQHRLPTERHASPASSAEAAGEHCGDADEEAD